MDKVVAGVGRSRLTSHNGRPPGVDGRNVGRIEAGVTQKYDGGPVAALRRIAFLMERGREETRRIEAFRTAAAAILPLPPEEIATRAAEGTLVELPGIGPSTSAVITDAVNGVMPERLARLEAEHRGPLVPGGRALRAALRGDLHSHSNWSDGGSPIEEMAFTAIELGHEYLVLTDHSPRLKVARGLSAERLIRQLEVVDAVNVHLDGAFTLLRGIEVDILADGSLDQSDELLAELDVVVGSVHSGLSDEPDAMTRRMLRAIANPHLDILGHCTGRKLAGAGEGSDRAHRAGRSRAESRFDAAAVFAACRDQGKAVEINCRPDRLDPPKRLLRQAYELGCVFAIDTDAHAPGQLDWLDNGCGRAALCGVEPDRVVNTWPVERLLGWTAGHAEPVRARGNPLRGKG